MEQDGASLGFSHARLCPVEKMEPLLGCAGERCGRLRSGGSLSARESLLVGLRPQPRGGNTRWEPQRDTGRKLLWERPLGSWKLSEEAPLPASAKDQSPLLEIIFTPSKPLEQGGCGGWSAGANSGINLGVSCQLLLSSAAAEDQRARCSRYRQKGVKCCPQLCRGLSGGIQSRHLGTFA